MRLIITYIIWLSRWVYAAKLSTRHRLATHTSWRARPRSRTALSSCAPTPSHAGTSTMYRLHSRKYRTCQGPSSSTAAALHGGSFSRKIPHSAPLAVTVSSRWTWPVLSRVLRCRDWDSQRRLAAGCWSRTQLPVSAPLCGGLPASGRPSTAPGPPVPGSLRSVTIGSDRRTQGGVKPLNWCKSHHHPWSASSLDRLASCAEGSALVSLAMASATDCLVAGRVGPVER